MKGTHRMRIRISILILTLAGGFAANADVIQPDGVITSFEGTRNLSGNDMFIGIVYGVNFAIFSGGPSHNSTLACHDNPCLAPGSYFVRDGSSGDQTTGGAPFEAGGGDLNKDGLSVGCAAFISPTCGFAVLVSYTLSLPNPGPTAPDQLILTTPFILDASLEGVDPRNGIPFSVDAHGAGTATVTLQHSGSTDQPLYFLQSARYDFSAVPEPATMTLAGLGLLAIILVRRRYRPGLFGVPIFKKAL